MVNRRLLYLGVFLVALGAVLLYGRNETADRDAVLRALQLWPIVVIGLGVALLLRGTKLGIAGGVLAAAMPGLLLGGLLVIGSSLEADCGVSEPRSVETQEGSFGATARVEIGVDCGELAVSMAPSTRWKVETSHTAGANPRIDVEPDRLSVASTNQRTRFGLPWSGGDFTIVLPTDSLLDLTAEVNAGRGRLDLARARLGDLRVDVNAGDVRVDLTGATFDTLALEANAASAVVLLPASEDFEATFDVNAGELTICASERLGLRIRDEIVLGSADYSGLIRTDGVWESAGYASATHHADVTVSVNVGSVNINPEGGCK